MKRLWPVPVLALAGCIGGGFAANPYPDREVLTFPSSGAGGAARYACAATEPPDDIRARGRKAHRAFEAALAEFDKQRSKVLLEGLESGKSPRAITRLLDARTELWAQTTADRIEARYHCIPLSGG